MKNSRKSITVLLMSLLCMNLNAQKCEIMNSHVDAIYSKEEIKKLENRICFLMGKRNDIPEDKKVKLYHIFEYAVKAENEEIENAKMRKKDFLDGSFIDKLVAQPEYRNVEAGRNRYIRGVTLVTNSTDSLIGVVSNDYFYLFSRYSKEYFSHYFFLFEKIRELKLNRLFTLGNFLYIGSIFGITDEGEIVVLFPYRDEKVLNLQEFVELYSNSEIYYDAFDE